MTRSRKRQGFFAVAAAALVALGFAASALSTTPPPITIDAGVPTHLTGSDVIKVAQDQLAINSQASGVATAVLSAHAMKGRSVATEIVGGPILEGKEAEATYWVVRANGHFVSSRGRGEPKTFTSGFFIIDDANAEIVGVGMP
jgi:hypothetical protein